tara:strand:+ start:673 stop:852 length:180 start_codon:yes stop_codon:yes gene_type:complete
MPTRAKYAKMTKYEGGGAVAGPKKYNKGGAVKTKGYLGGGEVQGVPESQTSGKKYKGIF